MGLIPDPEGVDLFVSAGEADEKTVRETLERIEAHRRHHDESEAVREAREILRSLGIDPGAYGMESAKDLLDHWRRAVEDPTGKR